MPTTVHDAAEYFADSVSRGAPALTEAAQAAYVDDVRTSYQRSKESSYSQYEKLTGTGPILLPNEGSQVLPEIPWESSWTVAEVKEWVAGTTEYDTWHHGVSVDGEPVGAGQLERALEAYSQELAHANRVTLLGWLENIPGVEQA